RTQANFSDNFPIFPCKVFPVCCVLFFQRLKLNRNKPDELHAWHSCLPEPPILEQLLLGLLPAGEAEALEQHLLECRACVQTVQALQTDDALVTAMRARVARPLAADQPERELVEGLIGRLMSQGSPLLDSATLATLGDVAPTDRLALEGTQELYDF